MTYYNYVVEVAFVTAFNQLHNVYPHPYRVGPAGFLFRKQQKDTAMVCSVWSGHLMQSQQTNG